MKEKIKKFFQKFWNYLKYLWHNPRTTLPAVIIAELIFWLPVWLPALLAITISPWWWSIAIGFIAFWAGPITPAIALQIAFIAAIERLLTKNKKSKGDQENGKRDE